LRNQELTNNLPTISLGAILGAKGDISGAETVFCRSLEIETMSAKGFCNLGLVLLSKGDINGAETVTRMPAKSIPFSQKHFTISANLQVKIDLDKHKI